MEFWLLTCRVDADQRAQEARFLDLAWAGRQGSASYPGFLNSKANWPLADPDGQPITQDLDQSQLEQSISLYEKAALTARSRRVSPPAASFKSHYRGPGGHTRQVAGHDQRIH